jgi:hypothetical protein
MLVSPARVMRGLRLARRFSAMSKA